MERRPRRTEPVGLALRVADKRRAAGLLVDTDQNPVSGSPRARNCVGLHMAKQLLIDALCRLA